MLKTTVLLLAALATAAPGSQIVHFSSGKAIVQASADSTQHVIIEDTRGNVTSDSYCDASSGRYDQIVQFATAVRNAAERDNQPALAALMQYPLRVNAGAGQSPKSQRITSRGMLLKRRQWIFTPAVLSRLRTMEPHDVFCRDGMSMIAGGTIWATADHTGTVRGAVVNL